MLIHTRVSGHIDAPIEQAWAASRDFQALPMWHVGVVAVKDVVGTLDQVGSTATLVIKTPLGLRDFHAEVTEVRPLELTAHVGREVDGPFQYTTRMQYTPAGRGYDYVWEQDNEFGSGLPLPFGDEAFATRLMEHMLRQSCENMQLFLEATVPQLA